MGWFRAVEEMAKTASAKVHVLPDSSSAECDTRVEELEALTEDALAIGCIPALKKHGHDVRYLLDGARSRYLELAEISADDDVLEIGSSLGQHTRLIARQCGHLSAIEVVEAQARFARIWCDEDDLDNVDIAAGGAEGGLPYDDASFDLVICNYVLEWCAGRSEMPPEDFHRGFLGEIFRVLKPGGRLLLSTKNRFSVRYLTGAEDEHFGARFGSALPRWVQAHLRRKADLGHPTGYLHSWRGLEKILAEIGFSRSERFYSFPDHRYPAYVGTFEAFRTEDLPHGVLDRLGGRNRLALWMPSSVRQITSNSIFLKVVK